MATVLVTGAAGFIGSHTCDLLLRTGYKVVGVDDLRTGNRANLEAASRSPAFDLREFDVAEPGRLAALVRETQPDAIIHLAALVSVPQSVADPELNFRQNVVATQRVFEAAGLANTQRLTFNAPSSAEPAAGRQRSSEPGLRVVFASSAAVYGDNPELPLSERSEARPISPYGGAKLASEALLLGQGAAFGITVRCLRYFNVFGPRQDPKSPYSGVISIFSDKLRAGEPPTIFGDGEQTRDFVSVHDVARANVLAATKPGLASSVTNICTGKPTSLNQLAAVLGRCFGTEAKPRYGDPRAGDIRHSLGSPERAKRELDWQATVSLEEGLRELAGADRRVGGLVSR